MTTAPYLVMRSHIESHEPLEENFRGLVVAKEGISVNIVELTGLRQRAARNNAGDVEAIQAQQVIQPLLYCIPGGISD